jgi:hypothetical protein
MFILRFIHSIHLLAKIIILLEKKNIFCGFQFLYYLRAKVDMKRLLLISVIFSFPSFLCARYCKILIPDTLIKQRIDYVDILSCCKGDGCNLVDIPRSDSISLIFYDYYESDDTTLYYGKEYDTYYYYDKLNI